MKTFTVGQKVRVNKVDNAYSKLYVPMMDDSVGKIHTITKTDTDGTSLLDNGLWYSNEWLEAVDNDSKECVMVSKGDIVRVVGELVTDDEHISSMCTERPLFVLLLAMVGMSIEEKLFNE